VRTFGIFNAAGCVEAGFACLSDAAERVGGAPLTFEDCYPAECCPRHPEQQHAYCVDCAVAEIDDAPSGHWIWVSAGP
jgi:hypothetical protein